MQICFERIRAKNFGSFGNDFVEIQFKDQGLVCCVGKNGAGKSTILLDALTYVLFDKAFKEVSKTRLINSITKQNLVVELEMYIGSDFYLIRRGQKPSLFEIYKNNKLIDQDSSNKDYKASFELILGMNYKTFKQLVVLGSASNKHFMNLPALDRRAVIEELLDLQVFTRMNLLLKDRQQNNINKISAVENRIQILTAQIDVINSHIEKIKEVNNKSIENKKSKISDIENIIFDLQLKYKELDESSIDVSLIKKSIKSLNNDYKELDKLETQIKYEINKINKDISFYKNNDECPTCRQSINNDFKEHICKDGIAKNVEFKKASDVIINKINNINSELHILEKQQNEYNDRLIKKNSINSKIKIYQEQIVDILEELKQINVHENVEEQYYVLTDLQKAVISQEQELEQLLEEKRAFFIAARMLKDDGIKTVVVKQYVPIINKLINKYLMALDFFCQFELDENFEEVIKSRYRDDFQYNSFSEGEKGRINLSILLAWRNLAELRNTVSTNLLVLDEIMDSSMDTEGTDELIKLIQKISDKNNVFIISHRTDMNIDKFNKVLEFNKEGNFSKIRND